MSLANAIGRTASPGGRAGGRLSARPFTDRGRPPVAPNEHCPKRPVLLAIGAPVRQCRLDPVGPLEVGEHEGRGEARRGERGRAPQGVRGARPPSRRISYREPSLARLGTRAAPRPPSPPSDGGTSRAPHPSTSSSLTIGRPAAHSRSSSASARRSLGISRYGEARHAAAASRINLLAFGIARCPFALMSARKWSSESWPRPCIAGCAGPGSAAPSPGDGGLEQRERHGVGVQLGADAQRHR